MLIVSQKSSWWKGRRKDEACFLSLADRKKKEAACYCCSLSFRIAFRNASGKSVWFSVLGNALFRWCDVVAIVNDFLYSYQGKSRHSTRLKAIIVKEEFKKLELVHVKIYGARETRSLRS